jgi:nitrite reductase/ring-hydroxylating ferredoxin subunit
MIIPLDDHVPEPGKTFSFQFTRCGREQDGFLLRLPDGEFVAYLNQCCHIPVPLDLDDNDFYWDKIHRITCKTHGAQYEPETGFCTAGPCAGATLEKFKVFLEDESYFIEIQGTVLDDVFIGWKRNA